MKGINERYQYPRASPGKVGFTSFPVLVVCTLQSFDFLRFKRCVAAFVSNERYQYPRASPGPSRLRLLFRPKGRGISPCFPGTRSGLAQIRAWHEIASLSDKKLPVRTCIYTACKGISPRNFVPGTKLTGHPSPSDAARTRRAWSEGQERQRTP